MKYLPLNKQHVSLCSSNLKETGEVPELYVYNICLLKFGSYHEWMAFLSVDEYIVLQPKEATRSLPEFLRSYAGYGGLAVNKRVFGSSGFSHRPRGGVLRNYVKCVPCHLSNCAFTIRKVSVINSTRRS